MSPTRIDCWLGSEFPPNLACVLLCLPEEEALQELAVDFPSMSCLASATCWKVSLNFSVHHRSKSPTTLSVDRRSARWNRWGAAARRRIWAAAERVRVNLPSAERTGNRDATGRSPKNCARRCSVSPKRFALTRRLRVFAEVLFNEDARYHTALLPSVFVSSGTQQDSEPRFFGARSQSHRNRAVRKQGPLGLFSASCWNNPVR